MKTLTTAVLILIAASFTASAEPGFQQLFDGKTLDGWDGDPKFWRVEEGALIGETTESNPTKDGTFLIWKGGEVADFELKIEFKLRNHNSGVQYRCFPKEGARWIVGGYQADMSADGEWTGVAWGAYHKNLLAKKGEKSVLGLTSKDRKVVAHVGDASEIESIINKDDWNEYHIIANGNQCIQKINGVITAEFSDSSEERLKTGLLALQLHQGPSMKVSFRNIRLRKLEAYTKKKILFLAGNKSHGYGAHEHNAGSLLLARCLNESGLDVVAQVVTEGDWPKPWMGYDKPDSVVMYCDGNRGHIAVRHQEKIQTLVDQGVGVACLHYGVEVDPGVMGDHFLQWIGGYFEAGWSVNPHWDAPIVVAPGHPISSGVKPFTLRDEWYYHMRFQPEMRGVTPILSALPPLRTLTDRAHDKKRGSNPTVLAKVKAGEKQVLAWAYERPSGGRGFGFTGGHFHQAWQQDDFRKVVLNALVWTAHGDVPASGVPSRTPSDLDMELNQDYSKPQKKK